MKIEQYLDSTYLKTSSELGVAEIEIQRKIDCLLDDAIKCNFKCVMLRLDYVKYANEKIKSSSSSVKVGTVIDFPLGQSNTDYKVSQAKEAIRLGANDIDFVCDYNAYKRGSFEKFDRDIIEATKVVLLHKRVVKWIIETGALSKIEIRDITKRITRIIEFNFADKTSNVFIKTSTGYYGGFGATLKDVKIIKSMCGSLKIKASGGVSNLKECISLINAGADRIGTSKALLIYSENK